MWHRLSYVVWPWDVFAWSAGVGSAGKRPSILSAMRFARSMARQMHLIKRDNLFETVQPLLGTTLAASGKDFRNQVWIRVLSFEEGSRQVDRFPAVPANNSTWYGLCNCSSDHSGSKDRWIDREGRA